MKINRKLFTPPHIFFTLFLTLSLLTGCMTGDDSKTTEYKLSFSANGGTGEMESITKEENEKINLPAVKFSRTGFEFLNWNTVADGSGTSYTDGAEFTFNTDTTLHAQWKEKKATPSNPETPENPTQPEQPQNPEIPSTPKTTYTVTFDANGGNGTIASISVEEGSEITLPENTFTKTGYSFAGWATYADGNVSYSDKAKIPITGNITLYAKWTAITYTITYEPNGGTNADGNPAGYTFETETITLLAPSRESFNFEGWYTDSEFSETNKKTEITKGSTGNITLYAKWTAITYTITYEPNGGTNADGNPAGYTSETETITLLAPSREYFDFGGWYTDSEFSDSSRKTEIAKGSTGNITLYAKWTAITYTITYEANGGTNADGNPASYTFETETITLLAPSREYFDFGGWYTDSEFSDSSRKTELAKGSSGNITLYVKWTVAAENAVNAINSLPTGEHKIAVTGQMTKDNLNGVIAAIKGNSNGAKVYLDLGGTAIDFYEWQRCKFADCENLIGIVIPAIESPDKNNPIILIPDLMFEGCKSLKTVIILNSSGKYKIITFKDCTSLEYVEIPTSIVCIYGDAFDGCTALETITYKGKVEQWKQVKTDYKKENYKLMSLNVQCENGTARGSDLIKE